MVIKVRDLKDNEDPLQQKCCKGLFFCFFLMPMNE